MDRILDLQNLSIGDKKLLNKIYNESRYKYNNFISALYIGNEGNISWLFSTIASRHPVMSSIFLNICYLEFIKYKIENNNIDIVYVLSKPLARILNKYFAKKSLNCQAIVNISDKTKIKTWLLPLNNLRHRILEVFHILYYTKIKYKRTGPQPNNSLILIETYIIPKCFDNGDYSDRYYPGIRDHLTEEEKKSIYYLPIIQGIDRREYNYYFKKMRESQYNFLIKDDILNLSDYFFAFWKHIRMLSLSFNSTNYDGYDLKPLLTWEKWNTLFDRSVFLAFLNYRFVKRLSNNKIRIRLFINWYENQISGRSINYAFNKFLPETDAIGYLGYIVRYEYLMHIPPTETEFSFGLIPDQLAVVGKDLIQPLKEFCAKLNIITAPAFRFQDVFRTRKYTPKENHFTILVTLPAEESFSNKLFYSIISFSTKFKYNNLIILIKSHPTNRIVDLKLAQKKSSITLLDVSTESFHDCLEKSNLLISNASSTCIEALAKGVPVLIFEEPSGLSKNPIPETIDPAFWAVCSSPYELNEQLMKFYKNIFAEIKVIIDSNLILNNYFEKCTETNTKAFLNLN